jgi:3-hydroxyisobutyrate dehydrogenase and related beta-hydroxyacid dehydrogenases
VIVIDSSTVDPQVPQTLSNLAREKQITFLDAPVSGGTSNLLLLLLRLFLLLLHLFPCSDGVDVFRQPLNQPGEFRLVYAILKSPQPD